MKDDPKFYDPAKEQHWDDIKSVRLSVLDNDVPKYGETDLGLILQCIKFIHDDKEFSAIDMGGKTSGVWQPGAKASEQMPVLYPIPLYPVAPMDKNEFNVILGLKADVGGSFILKALGGGRLGAVDSFEVKFATPGTQEIAVTLAHEFDKVCVTNVVWTWFAKHTYGGGYNAIGEIKNPTVMIANVKVRLYLSFGPAVQFLVNFGHVPLLDIAIPAVDKSILQTPTHVLKALCQAIYPPKVGEIGLFKASLHRRLRRASCWLQFGRTHWAHQWHGARGSNEARGV